MRIDGNAVWRGKLAGQRCAQSGQLLAGQVVDIHACADVRITLIYVQMAWQLSNVDDIVFNMQTARPMEIVPLIEIRTPVINNLDAMVFSIRDVNLSGAVRINAVWKIERSCISAVLSP